MATSLIWSINTRTSTATISTSWAYAAGDVKHQIGNTVKAACYGYRFQSFGEYRALLATCNVCAEEVKGKINGRSYQGIVYSTTDDKGEKVGNSVKATKRCCAGWKSLAKRLRTGS